MSIFALCLTAFWPVTAHQFLAYDDEPMVANNAQVKNGLNLDSFRLAFTTFQGGNWVPLTRLSHALDVELFGMDAGRHHLVNLLFHATNAVLLFLVLGALTGNPWRSALVAGLFAVHPLRVESVAWLTERKDVLSHFFALITIGAYLHCLKRPSPGRMLAVALCFALGLLSKPMLVTLPLLLILLDFWPLRRAGLRTALEKAPLFGMSLAAGIVAVISQSQGGAMQSIGAPPLSGRVANALIAVLSYLKKTVWPADLAVLYPHPYSWPALEVCGAALLLLMSLVWSIRSRRRRPYVVTGWLWFLIALAPVSGVVQVGYQAMADRYTYLAHIGIFIVAAWMLGDLCSRSRAMVIPAALISGTALAVLVLLTRVQVSFWRDDERLFRRAVAVTGDNFVALSNLANALIGRDRPEQAVPYLQQALRIKPTEAIPHNTLGIAFAQLGRNAQARQHFQAAIRFRRGYAEAYANLAKLSYLEGRQSEALAAYREALLHAPDMLDAQIGLGLVLMKLDRPEEAAVHFRHALRISPDAAVARHNLALLQRRRQ